jgi:hypothetical protein
MVFFRIIDVINVISSSIRKIGMTIVDVKNVMKIYVLGVSIKRFRKRNRKE